MLLSAFHHFRVRPTARKDGSESKYCFQAYILLEAWTTVIARPPLDRILSLWYNTNIEVEVSGIGFLDPSGNPARRHHYQKAPFLGLFFVWGEKLAEVLLLLTFYVYPV
jgi:hypothetical protein